MQLRRLVTTATATVAATMIAAGPAFAHYCQNVSVQGQAGEAWVLIDPATDEVIDYDGLKVKGDVDDPDARITGGGFVDLYLDFDGDRERDPEELLIDNMFLHASLPVSALQAAGCDHGVQSPFFPCE